MCSFKAPAQLRLLPQHTYFLPALRRDEYAALRADIAVHGIQVPLDVNGDTVLDGWHRLSIACELGLRTVPCRQVALDGQSPVVYMLKMALLRRQLTDDQRAAIAALWKKHLARTPGRPPKNSHNAVEVFKPSATLAPTLFNIPRRKVDEATFLLHHSPQRLAAVHHGTLSLKEALRQFDIEAQRQLIPGLKAPAGQFSVIVVDPPWPFDNHMLPYPTLSLPEIHRLPIPAAEHCLLWLWTVNAFLHEAFHVLESWRFAPRTVLTWVKDHVGTGDWLRGQTEHCILATRGNTPALVPTEHCILSTKGRPATVLTTQSTAFTAPVREHSRKPDEFFALVDSLCPYPDKLEMFARYPRPGWQSWGILT